MRQSSHQVPKTGFAKAHTQGASIAGRFLAAPQRKFFSDSPKLWTTLPDTYAGIAERMSSLVILSGIPGWGIAPVSLEILRPAIFMALAHVSPRQTVCLALFDYHCLRGHRRSGELEGITEVLQTDQSPTASRVRRRAGARHTGVPCSRYSPAPRANSTGECTDKQSAAGAPREFWIRGSGHNAKLGIMK